MMFEYYFSKQFIHFYRNKIYLEKLPYEVKEIMDAEIKDNPEKICCVLPQFLTLQIH